MKRPPAIPPEPLAYSQRIRVPRGGGWVLAWGDLFYDTDGTLGLYDEHTRVFDSLFWAIVVAFVHMGIVGRPRRNPRRKPNG